MPSERILNKLFEIAQENTSEEVNYNDFVKDILNSADLTFEDKTYNAEDEYLRNLLILAKHDGRIFGEYKNGKFVISESVIKSAKKETQRQFNIKREQVDNSKKAEEKENPFGPIGKILETFEKLDLRDKLDLVNRIDEMSSDEFKIFHKKTSDSIQQAFDKGELKEEDYTKLKEIDAIVYRLREGSELEKAIIVLYDEIKSGNKDKISDIRKLFKNDFVISDDIIMVLSTIEDLKEDIEKYQERTQNKKEEHNGRRKVSVNGELAFSNQLIHEYCRGNRFIEIEKKYRSALSNVFVYLNINERFMQENSEEAWKDLCKIFGKQDDGNIEMFDSITELIKGGELKFELFQNLLETHGFNKNLYTDYQAKGNVEFSIKENLPLKIPKAEEYVKDSFKDKEIVEKKASKIPGLEDLAVFDYDFADLGLPANIGEEAPVTDFEFSQIGFETAEIGKTREEIPSNETSVLEREEEPEIERESDAPRGIAVEEINSDAVTIPKKQEEVAQTNRLQLDLIKSFSKGHTKADKLKSYLGKLKDIKSQSYVGIDISNISEINDIA